jgi:PAS domain S-box-containing protein
VAETAAVRDGAGGIARALLWLPPFLFALAVAVLTAVNAGGWWPSPTVFFTLNAIFITTAQLLVAALAGVSAWDTWDRTMLFLGCGAFFLSMGAVLAGTPLTLERQNYAVTVYTTSALAAALSNFIGAVSFSPRRRTFPGARVVTLLSYAATFILAVGIAVAANRRLLPEYFIQGQGGTTAEYVVLWGAAILFVASAIVILILSGPRASIFTRWYAAGMVFFAVGLAGVSFQTRLGSPLNWVSRCSQYAGGVYMVIGVLVSVRRRAALGLSLEHALHESESRYGNLVNMSPDAVLVQAAGGVVYANPAAARLAGTTTARDLVGTNIMDLAAPESRDELRERIRREMAGDVLPQGELKLLRVDGRVVDVEITGGRVDWGGQPAIQELLHDITRRKQAQREIENSEARLRMAQAAAHAGTWEWDLETNANRWSDELWEVYGLAPHSVEPSFEAWLSVVHPDDRAEAERAAHEAAQNGAGLVVEWRQRGPDGSLRWVLSRGQSVRDTQGRVVRMIGIAMDVTERKEAEEAVLALERRLLHAQRLESLGVLAGGVAHDFNNILTAILGNIEVAREKLPPGSPALETLEQARRASLRAADLTRQMLAYSGKGKFIVASLDLNTLVRENGELFRTVLGRNVSLTVSLSPRPCTVIADAGQAQQVVMNLITNAAESIDGEAGVVTLATGLRDYAEADLAATRLEERPAPGLYAWIEVTDNGRGMDGETQRRIFEPFFSTKFAGRGLGMSAVLGIVRGHGGAILVRSAPGRGTAVRILFPASKEPAPGRDARLADETPGPRARGDIVLVADDEAAVLDLCAQSLRAMGFTVLTATDGEQAVELARTIGGQVSVAILDLTMPRMNGASATREMRRSHPQLPVILMSGYGEEEATTRLAEQGSFVFLKKPFSLADLERALGKALAAPA